MASRSTSVNPEPDTSSSQVPGGLADMLAGLLGAQGGSEPNAALRGLIEQIGGGPEGGIDDMVARLFPQGRTPADQEGQGLAPELLQAVAGAQAAGGATAVPDALKRALETLGVPAAMLEKILPAILSRLPALPQPDKKSAPSRQVRKSSPKAKSAPAKTTPTKPAPKSSGPTRKSKKDDAAAPSRKSGGTGKAGRSTGSGAGTSRSSSKSSGTGSRRKRSTESEGLNLDDLLKKLTP